MEAIALVSSFAFMIALLRVLFLEEEKREAKEEVRRLKLLLRKRN